MSYLDDNAYLVEELPDSVDAELEATPYLKGAHRRASTLVKEPSASMFIDNGDSQNIIYIDDEVTVASSGICSTDPSVVQEEKIRKTKKKLMK